jgi:hypothetical protein
MFIIKLVYNNYLSKNSNPAALSTLSIGTLKWSNGVSSGITYKGTLKIRP